MSNVAIDEAISLIKDKNKENLKLIMENMQLKYELGMLKSIADEVLKEHSANRVGLLQTYTKEILRLIEIYKTENKENN